MGEDTIYAMGEVSIYAMGEDTLCAMGEEWTNNYNGGTGPNSNRTNIESEAKSVPLTCINITSKFNIILFQNSNGITPFKEGCLDTTLCDIVYHWVVAGGCFSPDPPVSSTNKTDRHNMTQILLRVALNIITLAVEFDFRSFVARCTWYEFIWYIFW
jgi:hypothetical protein